MKGLNLFLATCFVVPTLNGAMADTVKNSGRTQTSSVRTQQNSGTITRTNNSVKNRNNTTTSRITTSSKNIVSRNSAKQEKTRSVTPQRETSVVSRSAKKTPVLPRFNTTTTPLYSAPRAQGLTRAATTQTRETVMQRDFSKCKSIFFDCMDEFCANKDAQLKRCACSARTNEFKATQKSLDNVEDKLLDFSQHLLKVNMDPADAAVINQETEGEKAYNETKDTSASRKTLNKIAEKLNTDFDSAGKTSLGALSWSLNSDSAFDSVDSLGGTATTAKSGTALRNAALPICREMAAEVCAEEDISLVENSYNMAIEQDCNTVKRAYETQTQQAKTKILESSALLDMTRLNNYQDNNSDDILTCKSKMLDMLTNTNVCGENLTKCLDISGRYINPTTGEAFLSNDLVNLSTLISRPTNTDSWAKTPANSVFVSYLNGKKKYMESATQNCQKIADSVWDVFIEDALAQIKLAQNEKLEEVRQSCTTLLAECLDTAKESLTEFDSRALSTFGVRTDKTVNALCANVKTACATIVDYDSDTATTVTGTSETPNWETSIINIQAQETYNTIINTCRELGRDCIINSCKSITGNFGLCEDIKTSVNRHNILSRAACWNEVYNCVAQASDESIMNIREILPNYELVPQDLYHDMYNVTTTVYDVCRDSSGVGTCANSSDGIDPATAACYRCRIAEQIWGNCQQKPSGNFDNKILEPKESLNTTTLLSWFAKNTHTQDATNSCATSMCPAGEIDMLIGTEITCKNPDDVFQCPIENILCEAQNWITVKPHNINNTTYNNCCPTNNKDKRGNCCMNGVTELTSITPYLGPDDAPSLSIGNKLCTNNSNNSQMKLVTYYTNNYVNTYIFCTGEITGGTVTADTENNGPMIICNGNYIIVENRSNSFLTYSYPQLLNPYSVDYFINQNADPEQDAEGGGYGYCPVVIENTVAQQNQCILHHDDSDDKFHVYCSGNEDQHNTTTYTYDSTNEYTLSTSTRFLVDFTGANTQISVPSNE